MKLFSYLVDKQQEMLGLPGNNCWQNKLWRQCLLNPSPKVAPSAYGPIGKSVCLQCTTSPRLQRSASSPALVIKEMTRGVMSMQRAHYDD